MNKAFGKNLSLLLKRDRISVTALAKKLGLPPTSINEWVDSDNKLPRDSQTIKKLAEFFKVGVHDLLFGEPDPRNLISEILEKTEIHTGLYEISVRKVNEKKIKKGDL